MFMKDDKKKPVSLVMEAVKPVDTKDGVEQDDSMALETAAEEFVSAIESKNPKMVVSAFKALKELCEYEESPEPTE